MTNDRSPEPVTPECRARLLRAFPTNVWPIVTPVMDLMAQAHHLSPDLIQESSHTERSPVWWGGEPLKIPYRLYNRFASNEFAVLSPAEQTAAGCLYTRHDNGRVRQRALHLALSSDVEWCAPFMVQLLGEYVDDIALDIEKFLLGKAAEYPRLMRGLRDFVGENPAFMTLTRARAISYWAEYYRSKYVTVECYPALRSITILESL